MTERRMYLKLALLLLASAPHAVAQAGATATKTYGLSVFGGYTRVHTDYGQQGNNGFTLGGDVLRHLRLFDPSLELRYQYSTGPVVHENNLSGGIKIEKEFHRFRPYGEFLAGHGTIQFQQPLIFASGPYTHDDALSLNFGGGVEYPVTPHFAVKADFLYQHWTLGRNSTLTPYAATAAVVYHIPFKSLQGRRFR